jgi:DNA primase
VTWEELPDVEAEDLTMATMPGRFAAAGDVHAGIGDAVSDLRVLLPPRMQPPRARKTDRG